MKRIDKKLLLEEQKKLNEINASGKYSFKQTIDDNGDLHVDCDPETFIKEMGYITLEDHLKRLSQIENECSKNSK